MQWVSLISQQGFSSSLFGLTDAEVRAAVTANGEIAHADIEATLDAFLRYASEMKVDVETGKTAGGRIEYGIGITLHIWF